MATHLEPSNYLANQKQGAANKHDLTVIIRLTKAPPGVQKMCIFQESQQS
jgi:hypothetical protein